MAADLTTYSTADTDPPPGPAVPSAREVETMGVIGLDMGRGDRVRLMNHIGAVLGVPAGGFHGQARLFKGNEVRLLGLLLRLANERQAKRIAENMGRAASYVQVNSLLALVSAAREFDQSLTATGTEMINTFKQGGLDFLDQQKDRLGLPRTILRTWKPAVPLRNPETGNMVYPERIPAHDQMLAYAAQISASFRNNFEQNLRREFGDQAQAALAASRPALLIWQAYAFLAPGGNPFKPTVGLRQQLGRRFGHHSALAYYAHGAKNESRAPSLDDIVTDHSLDHLEWVRSSKTRAAETLFLEHLLKRARELLPD